MPTHERNRIGQNTQLSHEKQVVLAKMLKSQGYSIAAIARIMLKSPNTIRILLRDKG